MRTEPAIHIVGGVYEEKCMRPPWHEIFGSAGRAASAIAALGGKNHVHLHCYVDPLTAEAIGARCNLENSTLSPTLVERTCRFSYHHGLDSPTVSAPPIRYAPIELQGKYILRFGLLEGDAIVQGERVVYDPQNTTAPVDFRLNGSTAKELVLILNQREAASLSQLSEATPVEEIAAAVQRRSSADAVVIKRGPLGALVYDGNTCATVPAYVSQTVWKIGSGDIFTSHFAHRWFEEDRSPIECATLASQATALYCESSGFPPPSALIGFNRSPVNISARYAAGHRPRVYLAGPFFTLAQLWLIEQVRNALMKFGLQVFSPYHDVGHGSADDVVGLDLNAIRGCDLLFAIGDGLDSGTLYEIGYARALDKPVILYCENESQESQKMMLGSGCMLVSDYVSAIYKTIWAAVGL